MPDKSNTQDSERSFYESFWQPQVALSCDEKCRMRFILSEMRRLRKTVNAVNRSTSETASSGEYAGTAESARLVPSARTEVSAWANGKAARLRIADVGCGRGWLTQFLSALGETTGFDRSVTEAKKRYPSVHFVECDILELPPNDFDVAICSEVIEHVRREQQPKLIETLFSVLRPGGTLIMTTPNEPEVSRLTTQLSLQKELQPVEDWLDAKALESLVGARFAIERIVTVMFFPIAVRRIGPLSRIYRAVYEEMNGYRVVDPLLQQTKLGLYIGLAGRKMPEAHAG